VLALQVEHRGLRLNLELGADGAASICHSWVQPEHTTYSRVQSHLLDQGLYFATDEGTGGLPLRQKV